jgi:hypothetical protein
MKPPIRFSIDIIERETMSYFQDIIQVKNDKGESIGEVSRERQDEIRKSLDGSVVIECIVTDLITGKALLPSKLYPIKQDVRSYEILKKIKKSGKEILKVVKAYDDASHNNTVQQAE